MQPPSFFFRGIEMTETINICPFCKEAGQKSQLHPSSASMTTLMASSPGYYDEDGKYVQVSDPNWTTRYYSCSNGHRFWAESRDGSATKVTRSTAEWQRIR